MRLDFDFIRNGDNQDVTTVFGPQSVCVCVCTIFFGERSCWNRLPAPCHFFMEDFVGCREWNYVSTISSYIKILQNADASYDFMALCKKKHMRCMRINPLQAAKVRLLETLAAGSAGPPGGPWSIWCSLFELCFHEFCDAYAIGELSVWEYWAGLRGGS